LREVLFSIILRELLVLFILILLVFSVVLVVLVESILLVLLVLVTFVVVESESRFVCGCARLRRARNLNRRFAIWLLICAISGPSVPFEQSVIEFEFEFKFEFEFEFEFEEGGGRWEECMTTLRTGLEIVVCLS
jgi:hypothetical protein